MFTVHGFTGRTMNMMKHDIDICVCTLCIPSEILLALIQQILLVEMCWDYSTTGTAVERSGVPFSMKIFLVNIQWHFSGFTVQLFWLYSGRISGFTVGRCFEFTVEPVWIWGWLTPGEMYLGRKLASSSSRESIPSGTGKFWERGGGLFWVLGTTTTHLYLSSIQSIRPEKRTATAGCSPPSILFSNGLPSRETILRHGVCVYVLSECSG